LVIFAYPFGVFFSSLAQYFFEQVELFTPHKLGQWLMSTLLASTGGTPIGKGLAGRRCHCAVPAITACERRLHEAKPAPLLESLGLHGPPVRLG